MRRTLIAILALALPHLAPAQDDRPPNLVLILADDLGWGDLGCYGQEKIATPNLDRLAAEGLRFTQFYAGSTVCAPSRCVLMTGRHTGRCLVRGNARIPLRPTDVTVAEVLKPRGYTTALIGKWGLGEEGSTGVPTKQGFDSFFGYLNQRHAHNYYPEFLFRDEDRIELDNLVPNGNADGSGVATERVAYSHDLFATEALQFVESGRDHPFFLYLALTIPHANNEAGKEGMEVPELGPYADRADWPPAQRALAAMIHRMDRDVGRLVDRVDELGLGENTLFLFTSDNGPHREGGNDPVFQDSNGPLKGIKRSLHDGGIRVPAIARWTGTVPASAVSDHIAGFQDVLPTFAELAGAERPDDLDGISFAPTLRGQPDAQREHDWLYWGFYERGSAQAVRAGKWKAIRAPMLDGPIRLYDLVADLGEEHDIAADHPDVVERMRAIMDAAHTPSEHWQVRGR